MHFIGLRKASVTDWYAVCLCDPKAVYGYICNVEGGVLYGQAS